MSASPSALTRLIEAIARAIAERDRQQLSVCVNARGDTDGSAESRSLPRDTQRSRPSQGDCADHQDEDES